MCYTYDELSRVTKRTLVNLSDNTETVEEYTYDAAGNITSSEADIDVTFSYDTNNRLAYVDGVAVTYDLDGNMTFASVDGTSYSGTFDSHNRLISMRGHTYTYDTQSVRIRDLTDEYETTFVYDTNARLSKLLVKTTDGVTTKYVYGRGLIGEESSNTFKTYHFDYRGSTIAITDTSGAVTDTFAYDTYGKRIARTGSTDTPFQYDGRDGVVTDETGLLYMRARYYSPDLRRFINADIIAGDISNAITLNRYAYANGNPVSNIDPFGLSAERGDSVSMDTVYWGVDRLNFLSNLLLNNIDLTLSGEFEHMILPGIIAYFEVSMNIWDGDLQVEMSPGGSALKWETGPFGYELNQEEIAKAIGSYKFDIGSLVSVTTDTEGNVVIVCSDNSTEGFSTIGKLKINIQKAYIDMSIKTLMQYDDSEIEVTLGAKTTDNPIFRRPGKHNENPKSSNGRLPAKKETKNDHQYSSSSPLCSNIEPKWEVVYYNENSQGVIQTIAVSGIIIALLLGGGSTPIMQRSESYVEVPG